MVEYNAVLKAMKLFGLVFIAASITELVFALIIGLTPVNVNDESVLLATILIDPAILPPEGTLFWIFIILLSCCFLILGLAFIKLSLAKNIEAKTLTKYLSIIGMLILIMTFVKIEYIVLMDKTIINYTTGSNPATYQSFLYNPNITPLYAAILWIVFMAISCGYLLMGLIVSASGLKFQLELERAEKEVK